MCGGKVSAEANVALRERQLTQHVVLSRIQVVINLETEHGCVAQACLV